jgi:hypothetical protein
LRYGCCLRGDRGREREKEWIASFVWRLAKKFVGKKWHQNNPGSNGQEETSTGPFGTNDQNNIYNLKKQIVEKLTSQARNTHDMHRVLL